MELLIVFNLGRGPPLAIIWMTWKDAPMMADMEIPRKLHPLPYRARVYGYRSLVPGFPARWRESLRAYSATLWELAKPVSPF